MTPADPLDSYTAAPAPPPRGSPSGRTILLIAVIAFLVGLAATAWALSRWDGWRSWAGARDAADEVAASAPTPSPTIPAATPALRTAPAANGGWNGADADGAEARAREAQLGARIAQLEARLATIDARAQAASGNASRAEGLLVAFAARRALDRGQQLGYLELQLRDLFGPVQPRAVAIVIQAARQPVTLEALRIGLDELAPELTAGTTELGWWEATRRELSNLIVLRRTGTPSPRPSDRLTRARRMLEGGQVDAALAEVSRMPGRDRAAAWMANARRFNQARRALDILETAAILSPSASALQPRIQAPLQPPVQTLPQPAAPGAATSAPAPASSADAALPTE